MLPQPNKRKAANTAANTSDPATYTIHPPHPDPSDDHPSPCARTPTFAHHKKVGTQGVRFTTRTRSSNTDRPGRRQTPYIPFICCSGS